MQHVKLGDIQPKPAKFKADYSYIKNVYLYKVDTRQQLVHRVPLDADNPLGAAYFEILPLVKPSTRRKRWRVPKLGVRSMATLATAIFVAGGFLVAYPLYPALQYEVSSKIGGDPIVLVKAAQSEPVSETNVLKIPKIGLSTQILEGPSLNILNKKEGVWHQRGNLANNFVLAGHRWKYLPPNTSTFYNLNKLEKGDTIVLDWYKQRFVYIITETRVISDDEDEVLNPTTEPQITLYTCNDRKETQRVLVIAKPLQ